MPSRPLPPSPSPLPHPHHRPSTLLIPAAASSAFLLLLLLFLYVYFSLRYRRRSPTLPFDFASPSPAALRRYSYRDLRSATASFDSTRLLGRGASASVFRALLPDGKSVAVKSVSATSSLSDLEFKNELHVLSSLRPSPFVVSLLGYCTSSSRRRRLLVYEYMPNGSLQEALFGQFLLDWDKRFQILLDVAGGLKFLHLECEPPVVHGDIKPSNVLLGSEFRAKIADFGLARFKVSPIAAIADLADPFSQDLGTLPSQELNGTVSPEFEFATRIDFEGRVRCNPIATLDDEREIGAKGKEAAFSPNDSKELNDGDWWWKQEGSAELNSRDYVREWIGSQICPSWENEELKSELAEETVKAISSGDHVEMRNSSSSEMKQAGSVSSQKIGSVKEWWKEDYFAEMSNKSESRNRGSNWFRKSNSSNIKKKKRRRRRSKSAGSEMFSGDLFSRELSSTATSMRGTICYVAPEHGRSCGQFMEKADIYSLGVLILVIVSGRRPLHVLSAPMKLERANLISWCRQLASTGSVLDLVDERLRDSFDKEQASLCINLALLCLQKSPELRPDTAEILKILNGEMDLPAVPVEFSPSPASRMLNKSIGRKATHHDPA